jgi:radical SAM protein with 4Fe4S-binding SPASM domain
MSIDITTFDPHALEAERSFQNIGWTLGNDCPYRCTHCYSLQVRERGMNLEDWMVHRIIENLVSLGISTVNLGGNEPIFTNGLNVHESRLPLIIRSLTEAKVITGLTTAGITLQKLHQLYPDALKALNDVDISIDSPFPDEHNRNRGAKIFDMALDSARLCSDYGIEHTLVMCGMSWNLSNQHLEELLRLAKLTKSNVRINFLKPTDANHHSTFPTPDQYYNAFVFLAERCTILDLGEPLLTSLVKSEGGGCPCGTKSFRIHSITPDGRVPISPCVYMHDYRVGDLTRDSIHDIISLPEFRVFRQRRASPEKIEGCDGCEHIKSCRGGCAARAYYAAPGEKTVYKRDPYCLRTYDDVKKVLEPFDARTVGFFDSAGTDRVLVHQDYLCTLIVEPR